MKIHAEKTSVTQSVSMMTEPKIMSEKLVRYLVGGSTARAWSMLD